jgi:hypothetical protein
MQRLLASCVIAAVAGAGGCADSGDEAILVQSNVIAGDNCTTTAGTQTVLAHGSLDLLLPSGYLFFADLKSRITALVGQEDQRTIIVTGANIDIAFPGSTLFSAAELTDLRTQNLTHFKAPFSTLITPGGTSTVPFEMVPEALVERIIAKADLSKRFRLEALATFSIVGNMSGESVSSQPFTYAVTIGNQVSVNITGNCSALATGFIPRKGYSCNPAQDGIIDCCLDGNLVCPAPTPQ